MILKKLMLIITLFASVNFQFTVQAKNIGLCIVATGKYIQFVQPLIISAQKFFCTNHLVKYFIFTDGELPVLDASMVKIEQKRLGWPYDTMMRFDMYSRSNAILSTMDYLFACDADMRFVDHVGDEILSERVATQHPGFVNQRGSYETNSFSTAYIASHEGNYYFAGGFYGGTATEFLNIARVNIDHIKKDLEQNYIAVWHDESHLNRYFIDHKPTLVLSPAYCYPEKWTLPYPKKLLALDKDHAAMRETNQIHTK